MGGGRHRGGGGRGGNNNRRNNDNARRDRSPPRGGGAGKAHGGAALGGGFGTAGGGGNDRRGGGGFRGGARHGGGGGRGFGGRGPRRDDDNRKPRDKDARGGRNGGTLDVVRTFRIYLCEKPQTLRDIEASTNELPAGCWMEPPPHVLKLMQGGSGNARLDFDQLLAFVGPYLLVPDDGSCPARVAAQQQLASIYAAKQAVDCYLVASLHTPGSHRQVATAPNLPISKLTSVGLQTLAENPRFRAGLDPVRGVNLRYPGIGHPERERGTMVFVVAPVA